MKNIGRQFTLAVTCAALLSGCAIAHAPVTAPLNLFGIYARYTTIVYGE